LGLLDPEGILRGEELGETEDMDDSEEEAEGEEREEELRVDEGDEMSPLLRVDIDAIAESVSLAEEVASRTKIWSGNEVFIKVLHVLSGDLNLPTPSKDLI
jgi:hypothetical protein